MSFLKSGSEEVEVVEEGEIVGRYVWSWGE
jgi:hypothetical protein